MYRKNNSAIRETQCGGGTGEQIMALISELNQDGLTVVMVTHDPDYANLAKRTIRLEDGVMI